LEGARSFLRMHSKRRDAPHSQTLRARVYAHRTWSPKRESGALLSKRIGSREAFGVRCIPPLFLNSHPWCGSWSILTLDLALARCIVSQQPMTMRICGLASRLLTALAIYGLLLLPPDHALAQSATAPVSNSPALGNLLKCREIIVVRHAERENGSDDSPLSKAGQQRALDLLQELKDAAVTRIFVSDKVRTQDTARPLANFLGPKCHYSTNLLHAWNGNQVVEYVKTNVVPDDVVLIVFHGDFDKLPFLLRRLGGPENELINGFDKMYLFRPDPSGQFLSMTRRAYGKKSP